MTKHVTDYYMDGHIAISFCKVCSAEGLKLLADCPQIPDAPKKYIDPNKIIDDFEKYY